MGGNRRDNRDPVLRLGQLGSRYRLEASCPRCKHGRILDLPDLVRRLGADFLISDVQKRLRCSECGSRAVRVRMT